MRSSSDISARDGYSPSKVLKKGKGKYLELTTEEDKENIDVFGPVDTTLGSGATISKINALQLHEDEEWIK